KKKFIKFTCNVNLTPVIVPYNKNINQLPGYHKFKNFIPLLSSTFLNSTQATYPNQYKSLFVKSRDTVINDDSILIKGICCSKSGNNLYLYNYELYGALDFNEIYKNILRPDFQ